MKKSKSMIENGNVYSGDDEGFESAPEKVNVLEFYSDFLSPFQAPLLTSSYDTEVNGGPENQENSSEDNQGMSV